MPLDGDDWVSPSEIAAFAYCGRAYFLERVQRVEADPSREPRLDAGTRAHRAHNIRVTLARWIYRLAWIAALISLALIARHILW